MAGEVLGVMADELTKFREKMLKPKTMKNPFFVIVTTKAKATRVSNHGEDQVQDEAANDALIREELSKVSSSRAAKEETLLSESTVCLLMDRFSPC